MALLSLMVMKLKNQFLTVVGMGVCVSACLSLALTIQ